jgi:hypothetical protein
MKILMALAVALAACSGPKAKPESPIVNEGSAKVGETCCCKSTPIAGDGTPVYEPQQGRMDCSSKQGTCVDDVQCQKQPTP